MDGLGAGWISSFQQLEKLVGCIVHSGLCVQHIWGCHGSAQQMWGCSGEAGLHHTQARMRKNQRSSLHQALDGANTTLGSTMCWCPRRGRQVRLQWELSLNLQPGKGEVPLTQANQCLALSQLGFWLATCIQTDPGT